MERETEMIGILDAARFSERSGDSGRGKEPRLCPAPIPAMESLLIGFCDWKDYARRVPATAQRPNVSFMVLFPVVTVQHHPEKLHWLGSTHGDGPEDFSWTQTV